MGMATRIYGCITELDYGLPNSEIQSRINANNQKVIEKLPSKSEWPPLVRKMFSITDNSDFPNESPNFAYGGRIIHFGANLKSVEYEWNEWKDKFENLLSELISVSRRSSFYNRIYWCPNIRMANKIRRSK
ncbi:hypothetical protein N7U66_04630 [Lacinutrix neustonica]|uniref:Uncharacterized protein n=1 Tax=Lacinutrix neustonica TaxID=2980107 RepID=A0A9E8MWH4_9FLAO|nr:hypothetical protein [Lacinutrix neustonica]WAC02917.1 hypothetical protein N7U66_04630 [Lacinutrix neustonica]